VFPQRPAAVRVFLCTRPTDMRKSFDGLTGLVQERFGQDPVTGHLVNAAVMGSPVYGMVLICARAKRKLHTGPSVLTSIALMS
jgi:hypothetical protein